MTGSYFARTSSEMADVVAIEEDYRRANKRIALGHRFRAGRKVRFVSGHRFSDPESSSRRPALAVVLSLVALSYGFFASGALKYFSSGISKYINSFPPASCTPVT